MTPPDQNPPDPAEPVPQPPDGASAERTRLAWRRTVLATTVVALLTIRVAIRDGHDALDSIAIALACGGWLAQLWLAQRRIRAMAVKEPRYIRRSLPAFALVITGFAGLGAILVALGAWHG